MLDGYILFIVGVVLLRCGATPRDRNALTVVLSATIASWLLVTLITQGITGSWKLAIPATLEILTILALLKWARNRTGWMQAGLLAVAWYVHLLDYIDIQIGTNMIYDNYGRALGMVSALQLAACHDTYLHHFRRFAVWCSPGSDRPVRAGGAAASVFHHSHHASDQSLLPCNQK